MIVHQEVWRGRVWAARPFTVVEDDGDRLLLWMPVGTRRKVPMTPPHRADPEGLDDRVIALLDRCDWVHVDHSWEIQTLWIVRDGDWHSTWVSWLPNGDHYGWYINLQEPLRRTGRGIQAMDLMLDVVVEPDLRWRWKDRDQFDRLVHLGLFDQATGERVQTEAETMIQCVERRVSPFDEPWPEWRPGHDLPRPTLPSSWEDPQP